MLDQCFDDGMTVGPVQISVCLFSAHRKQKLKTIRLYRCVTDLTSAAASSEILLMAVRKRGVKLCPDVKTAAAAILSASRWSCWAVLVLTAGLR